MSRPRFRQLPHAADLRLAIWGRSEEELLRNAVAGVVRAALAGPAGGVPERWAMVERWPASLSGRLVGAINEALFYLYSRRLVAVASSFSATSGRLGLVPLAAGRQPAIEIKAATFYDLRLEAVGQSLRAIVTLDL
ncbi:MAG: archease [Acidobacteriota bacterium]